jgi:uncharacterized membrane protein YtjA (UPF0391 family)
MMCVIAASGTYCSDPTGHYYIGRKEVLMLSWALMFFVLAIIAALFGFTGIAAASASIAKILFVLFLVLFLVSLVVGTYRGRRPPV